MFAFWKKTAFSSLVGIPMAAAIAGIALAATPADASVITFSEPTALTGAGAGFNSQNNPFLISSDGEYRVEAFWLNTGGHFHIQTFLGNQVERNHNCCAPAGGSGMQGIRITRVDGGLFDLQSFDLLGQAAVGLLTDVATGAGDWTLFAQFTGTAFDLHTFGFGGAYTGLSEIFFANPAAAGGTTSTNYWDNITLAQHVPTVVAVPAPGALALIGVGLLGLGLVRRRRPAAA